MPAFRPELPQRRSLVYDTARALRENIRLGIWSDQLPGERELCDRLQVSRPTLRAALDELQRDGTLEAPQPRRRRVIAATRSDAATATQRLIAVISPRPLLEMPPSAVVMVDELRIDLARAGFELELVVNPAAFSEHPERTLDSLVARIPSAAWIAFGSREPMQQWFLRRQLPCLVAGSCAQGIALPSLDIDYRATCRHAGGLLLGKGHRRIALCLPEGATGGEADSESGLREAVSTNPAASVSVIRHDGTAVHLCALLDQAVASDHPPTAILVARAVHVLTVITHLLSRGLQIPGEMAVISRDDESFLRHLTPTVAHYSLAPTRFARRLSRAARQLAETGSLPLRATRLIPGFVPGETLT
ncbi:MAG: substrate-binding domain-containing protein [Verrucomicrobiales bacterium]